MPNKEKQHMAGINENDYPNWFEKIGKEIYRVLKPTGSFVLNIKEHSKNGIHSTYVLETVLKLSKILRWSDTFIWNKSNPFPTGNPKKLKDGFEYCYWFTKSKEYKFFPNNVLEPSTSKWLASEKNRSNKGEHNTNNGSGMNMTKRCAPDMVRPSNVITFPVDSTNHNHPATFPEKLPEFFIKLMSEPGDIVLDPFAGSGTTGIVSKNLDREFIGIELKKEYYDIAKNRIEGDKNEFSNSKNSKIKR